MDIATLILIAVVILVVATFIAKAVVLMPQGEAAVIERLGSYTRTISDGTGMIIPFIDRVRARVDTRERVVSFPPQAVITQDNLTVAIDIVVTFQINDPARAIYGVDNYIVGVEQISVATLRDVVGGMTLEETLTSRDIINRRLRGELDGATTKWGLRISRVELKAIDPPPSIQQSMEMQMKAEREKRAMILTAEGQRESDIRTAEGQKQARILTAEGEKHAAILRAEAERQAVTIIALRAPMADDLREIIAAMKISNIIERIGDYAKNIAKRVPTLAQTAPVAPMVIIPEMTKLAASMVRDALDAYVDRDASLALDVMNRDQRVDEYYNSLFRSLLTYMMENPHHISASAHLLFIAKNLERIGDHATNIAEMVHFSATGDRVPDRIKSDETPFIAPDIEE